MNEYHIASRSIQTHTTSLHMEHLLFFYTNTAISNAGLSKSKFWSIFIDWGKIARRFEVIQETTNITWTMKLDDDHHTPSQIMWSTPHSTHYVVLTFSYSRCQRSDMIIFLLLLILCLYLYVPLSLTRYACFCFRFVFHSSFTSVAFIRFLFYHFVVVVVAGSFQSIAMPDHSTSTSLFTRDIYNNRRETGTFWSVELFIQCSKYRTYSVYVWLVIQRAH